MEEKKTCLYDKHVAMGALMSPFGGFIMPIQYSNITDEHQAVRQACGVFDAIVINPAAYTHTSIAIPDALKAVRIPAVEVHLSDPARREAFRRVSYVRSACVATIAGHGFDGYTEAMDLLCRMLKS